MAEEADANQFIDGGDLLLKTASGTCDYTPPHQNLMAEAGERSR